MTNYFSNVKIVFGNKKDRFQWHLIIVLVQLVKAEIDTGVLIRDLTRSVAKQVSVAVDWVKIKISLMAQLKGLTAKFKLM